VDKKYAMDLQRLPVRSVFPGVAVAAVALVALGAALARTIAF
jgi:hypothetical protein